MMILLVFSGFGSGCKSLKNTYFTGSGLATLIDLVIVGYIVNEAALDH